MKKVAKVILALIVLSLCIGMVVVPGVIGNEETENNDSVYGSVTYIENDCEGVNRIYDVNRDGVINYQDAGLCWVYTTTPEIHCEFGDLLYDVNMDGQVNFQDAGLIWVNRD